LQRRVFLVWSGCGHQPIEEYGGAPAIQTDLRWSPGTDAFVLGAYGALQLGPDAVNLAGARRGSRLVAKELWDARLCRWRAQWQIPPELARVQHDGELLCRSSQQNEEEEENQTSELGFLSSLKDAKEEQPSEPVSSSLPSEEEVYISILV